MPLSPPIVTGVFFQADTVKGYRFWDETGVLANHFADRFHSVSFSTPEGLVCTLPKHPDDHIQALRINTANIALAFRPDTDWDRHGAAWVAVRQETPKLVDWIARATYVTRFSRLGLRVILLYGGEALDVVHAVQRSAILKLQNTDWSSLGTITTGDLVLSIEAHHLMARIALDTVQVQGTARLVSTPGTPQAMPDLPNIPDVAVRLDADLVDKSPGESIDVKPHLNHAITYLYERVVPFVTQRVSGGNHAPE